MMIDYKWSYCYCSIIITSMFLGQYSPRIFFLIPFYITIPTLVLIYQISLYYGHEPPFPHCWISKVAQHYPEFVFFRFATISGAVMIILGWFSNYFYMMSIAREKAFHLRKYHPEVILVVGIMGCLLLMGNTATIDTGIMKEKWHVTCASAFFIITLLAQVLNTLMGWLIYYKIKTLSLNVMYAKTGHIVALLIQIYISKHFGEVEGMGHMDNALGNDWDKAIEWTLTATILIGFYFMSLDLCNFQFVYEGKERNTLPSEMEAVR